MRPAPLLLVLLLACTPLRGETLLDVYRHAVENNPELLASAAGLRAVEERREQARGWLLPEITLSASTARVHQSRPTTIAGTYDDSQFTLSLSQAVFRYDYLMTLEKADLTSAQAQARHEAVSQALMVRVAERYFAVLSAADDLEFAKSEKRAIAQQLERAKRRFEVGLAATTDVQEAQAKYDIAGADLIRAENAQAAAWEALREVTGRGYERIAALSDTLTLLYPEPAEIDRWQATAEEKNLALLAARYALREADYDIRIRRAGHYPSVELTASKAYANSESGFTPATTDRESIGLQLSLPLYRGGRTESQVREANHLHQQAFQQVENEQRRAVREVRDAYRGIVSSISEVNALKQALRSTESALEATRSGFEVGTRTLVDVLNTQRDLHSARRTHALAKYQYVLNLLRLKQAAGSLAPADLTSINGWLE